MKLAALLMGCLTAFGQAPEPPLARVLTAAKLYFRDIDEFPMDVSVTTMVTDKSGQARQRYQAKVRFIFRGYNPESETARFWVQTSFFTRKALSESMAGHSGVMHAGLLLRGKVNEKELEIQPPAGPGQPVVLKLTPAKCEDPFQLWPGFAYPKQYCGVNEYRLSDQAGDLVFEHFQMHSLGLPVAATVPYLGVAQVQAFDVTEDFQRAQLPGDPKPFLLPHRVVTTLTADKGKVEITNVYEPAKAAKH